MYSRLGANLPRQRRPSGLGQGLGDADVSSCDDFRVDWAFEQPQVTATRSSSAVPVQATLEPTTPSGEDVDRLVKEEGADMAEVEIAGDRLIVQMQGLDRLWTLKSRLEIPLAHVTGAEADPDVVRGWKGWRGPGAHIPGVVVAGTFHHQGDRVFWDVHDADKAVVIHLVDERYARLVIGVQDPAETVAAIRRAVGPSST